MKKISPLHVYRDPTGPYWVVAWHTHALDSQQQQELFDWCYEQFGPGLGALRVSDSPFVHRWINDIEWGELRFHQDSDMTLFQLRWL